MYFILNNASESSIKNRVLKFLSRDNIKKSPAYQLTWRPLPTCTLDEIIYVDVC